MKITFSDSFNKDIAKLKDKNLNKKIVEAIEAIEKADSLNEIHNLKKLIGYKYHYRIRVGDYRLGIYIINDQIEIVRLLHRKEIYRYFP
jgi:mRNA interferase RelE/StbE